MKKERLLELLIHFQNSKEATKHIIESPDFDDEKKSTMKIASDIFNDVILLIKYVVQNESIRLDEIDVNNLNNGENNGERPE